MYSDSLGPISKVIDTLAGSRMAFRNSVYAIGAVNIGLSLAVFAMGMNKGFPMDPLLKWVLVTLFFGFLTAGRMVKIAFKYEQKVRKEDVIGVHKDE
jgi:hypothetical protein